MGVKVLQSKNVIQLDKGDLQDKLMLALAGRKKPFELQGEDDILQKLEIQGYKQISDLWDTEKKGESISVQEGAFTAALTSDQPNKIQGRLAIKKEDENDKFFFQIQIDLNNKRSNIILGISRKKSMFQQIMGQGKEKGGYWLVCQNGCVQTTGGELIKNIDQQIVPGSTITVVLDMGEGKISFILDNLYQENPITHEDLTVGEFYITLQLFDQGDKARILNPPETQVFEKIRKLKIDHQIEKQSLEEKIKTLEIENEILKNKLQQQQLEFDSVHSFPKEQLNQVLSEFGKWKINDIIQREPDYKHLGCQIKPQFKDERQQTELELKDQETSTNKVVRYHYGVQATAQVYDISTQTQGKTKIYEKVQKCLNFDGEAFGVLMDNINEYFYKMAHEKSPEIIFVANYLLSRSKLKEIDDHLSTLNNKETRQFEPKCVQKLIDNLRFLEIMSPDKFENLSWWKTLYLENEDELLKDIIDSFNLHEQLESDPDQMKQIFIRKMILQQLYKYPSHVDTYSSCSNNKKVLGIREKVSTLQGLDFENMTGWKFREANKFLERFMIVLMTSASMEKQAPYVTPQ